MAADKLFVFKVGGNVIDDDAKLSEFLTAFSTIKGKKVLIHGGGKVATRLAKKMNLETKMIDGRRITDEPMLEIVTMAYAGKVNKSIASQLLSLGQRAVGVAGFDGGTLTSVKRPVKNGLDFGLVGDIEKTDPTFLKTLLSNEFVPVLAPLTNDTSGQILNTNADTIANEVAVSLSTDYEVNLIYVFELSGVMKNINDKNSLVKEINHDYYIHLKEEGVIKDGMIPKLDNAFNAIDRGVKQVSIVHFTKIKELNNSNFDGYTRIK